MKTTYFMGGGRRGIARRMSMDEPSLTLTTSPAMKQTERCHPEIIDELPSLTIEKDTVLDELKTINNDLVKAIYLLAFSNYEGF